MYANSCFHSDTTRLFRSTVILSYRWGVCSVVRALSKSFPLPFFPISSSPLPCFFPPPFRWPTCYYQRWLKCEHFSFTKLTHLQPQACTHQLSSRILLVTWSLNLLCTTLVSCPDPPKKRKEDLVFWTTFLVTWGGVEQHNYCIPHALRAACKMEAWMIPSCTVCMIALPVSKQCHSLSLAASNKMVTLLMLVLVQH